MWCSGYILPGTSCYTMIQWYPNYDAAKRETCNQFLDGSTVPEAIRFARDCPTGLKQGQKEYTVVWCGRNADAVRSVLTAAAPSPTLPPNLYELIVPGMAHKTRLDIDMDFEVDERLDTATVTASFYTYLSRLLTVLSQFTESKWGVPIQECSLLECCRQRSKNGKPFFKCSAHIVCGELTFESAVDMKTQLVIPFIKYCTKDEQLAQHIHEIKQYVGKGLENGGIDVSPYGQASQCWRVAGAAKKGEQDVLRAVPSQPGDTFVNVSLQEHEPVEALMAGLAGVYPWSKPARHHVSVDAGCAASAPTADLTTTSAPSRKRRSEFADMQCAPLYTAPVTSCDIHKIAKLAVTTHTCAINTWNNWHRFVQAVFNELGSGGLPLALYISRVAPSFESDVAFNEMWCSLSTRGEGSRLTAGSLVHMQRSNPGLTLVARTAAFREWCTSTVFGTACLEAVVLDQSDPSLVVAFMSLFREASTTNEEIVTRVCEHFRLPKECKTAVDLLRVCSLPAPEQHIKDAMHDCIQERVKYVPESPPLDDGRVLPMELDVNGDGHKSDDDNDMDTEEDLDRPISPASLIASVFVGIARSPPPPPEVFSACRRLLGTQAPSFLKAWASSAPDPATVSAACNPSPTGGDVQDSELSMEQATRLILCYAAEHPALTLGPLRDSEGQLKTAHEFVARIQMGASSWDTVILAGKMLYRSEKREVTRMVAGRRYDAEGSGSVTYQEMLAGCERQWMVPLPKNKLFCTAMASYLHLKVRMAGDSLMKAFAEQLTLDSEVVAVYPGNFVETSRVGNRTAVIWIEREGGKPATSTTRAYSIDLQTLHLSDRETASPVEGAFWLPQLLAETPDPGYMDIASFVGRRASATAPIQYDKDLQEWRFFCEESGVWLTRAKNTLGKSMQVRSAPYHLSCLLDKIIQPKLAALEYLLRECSDKGDKHVETETRKQLRQIKAMRHTYTQTQKQLDGILDNLKGFEGFSSSFTGQPPNMVAVANGILDLKTKKLECVSKENQTWVKGLGLTEEQYIQTRYVDNMENVREMTSFYLQHVVPRDLSEDAEAIVNCIQLFGGYSLTAENNIHKYLTLLGSGANMKTCLAKMHMDTLGKGFVGVLKAKDLNMQNGPNNDNLYRVRNKRTCLVNESGEANLWDDELVKSLTGGEDSVTVAAKYKNSVEFEPISKLWAFQNTLPRWSAEHAFALFRRAVILEMPLSYAENDAQKAALIEQGVPEKNIRAADTSFFEREMKPRREQYLAWLVDGAHKYYAAGKHISFPAVMEGKHAMTKAGNLDDMVEDYVANCFLHADGAVLPFEWIFRHFKRWAMAGGCMDFENVSQKKFGSLFKTKQREKHPKAGYAPCLKYKVGNETETRSVSGYRGLFWADDTIKEDATLREESASTYKIKGNPQARFCS